MTTQTPRRVLSCLSCGFKTDHIRHLRACVPFRYWPKEQQEHQYRAMRGGALGVYACACGQSFRSEADLDAHRTNPGQVEPERPMPEHRERPHSLYEYRLHHPEAWPLVEENIERTEMHDGFDSEGKRAKVPVQVMVSLREAKQTAACPRCQRPLLVPNMHLTCKPVDAPMPVSRVRVVTVSPQERSGPGWYENLPVEPDDDEPEDDGGLEDYIDPVTARLKAEQAAWTSVSGEASAETAAPSPETGFACDFCDRTSPTRAGIMAHMRSHRADA